MIGEKKPRTTILPAGDEIRRIVSVSPQWVPADADTEIEVQIHFAPFDPDYKFCRFGALIVPGAVSLADQRLRCSVPKGKAGNVRLSISKDGVDFFGNADFAYVAKSNSLGWWIFTALCVGFMVVFIVVKRRGRIAGRRRVPLSLSFKDPDLDGPVVKRRHTSGFV
jgi:hypothetical protein